MNMVQLRRGLIMAVPALALAMVPALAQPPAKGDQPAQPGAGGGRQRPGQDPVVQKYREEFKTELKEHPRIAASLVSLHVTKEHLKDAPHDFGGHKAAAIAAVDEAIKQLHEAIKFDAKQEEPKPADGGGDTPPRRRRNPG